MAEDNTPSFLRDDAGRFASSKEPAAEVPVTPVDPTPTEPPKVETPAPAQMVEPPKVEHQAIPPGYIPLAAQLDERDKRKALQAELDELKRRHEEATRKPVELDPIGDQEGFTKHFEGMIAKNAWDTLTRISKSWAVRNHGQAAVDAAEEAVKAEVERNPGFFQQIERQPDPYDFSVSWHKRQLALAKIGDKDPDAWFEEQAKERGYILANPNPAPGAGATGTPSPTTPAPLPRPSLASAPAAGGNAPKQAIGPGVAFAEVFK